MSIKDRSIHPPPEKHDEEGWLANADQGKIVQFKPDAPTAHGQWVIIHTFHWRTLDYPIPQTRRRMLRQNTIKTLQKLLKTGWRRCCPPVRSGVSGSISAVSYQGPCR
mgnify:FL=1